MPTAAVCTHQSGTKTLEAKPSQVGSLQSHGGQGMPPVEPLHPVPCLKVTRIYSLAFVSYPECPEMVYGDVLRSCCLVLSGATGMSCLCSPSLPFVPSGASTHNIHIPSSLNIFVMEPCMAKKTFFTWRGDRYTGHFAISTPGNNQKSPG